MAATQLNRARTIKKVEKPRPLKLNQRHSTVDGRITTGNFNFILIVLSQQFIIFRNSFFAVEDIVSLIDNVAMQLTNGFHDRTLQTNVVTMCNHLKLYAPQLEAIYKGIQFSDK